MVDAAHDANHALSHQKIAEALSTAVAKRFRIPGKGGIAVGKDADLTLVDPNAEEVISTDSLHYRHRQSPYVGRKLRAPVVRTILRGQTIFERGKLIGKAKGQFVRPEKT